ncbi:MAG TPA: hypothetical protein VFS44_01675 [Gemmatimonadaceae bacterium]|nr:hypothetical protein [Gemmatimonadaceae bacterium]
MQRSFGVRDLIALVILALIVTACGSSDSSTGPGLTAADVAGTYDLVSITFPQSPPLGPPEASGVLTLSLSNYKVDLQLPPPTGAVTDSGTYTVSGSQWTQSSMVENVQSTGTASLSHDTLYVTVTTAGQQVANVWKRR